MTRTSRRVVMEDDESYVRPIRPAEAWVAFAIYLMSAASVLGIGVMVWRAM